MPKMSAILGLIRQTHREYQQDAVPRLAAALAYFALFSLTPLLVLGAGIADRIMGMAGGTATLITRMEQLIGHSAAEALRGMLTLQAAPEQQREFGALAIILSVGAVVFGTTRLFNHMKASLNYIWDVAPSASRSVRGAVWRQFLIFVFMLAVGGLLILSLLVNAGVGVVGQNVTKYIPAQIPLLQVLNIVISFGLITLMLAAIYRGLPDAQIAWRDVWAGALFTAAVFVPGQYLIGWYIAKVGIGSAYGAAGSIIILLVWIYFAATVFLLGAEFTQVYATTHGRSILPDARAMRMLRHSAAEHQAIIEREFEERLKQIRDDAATLKQGDLLPAPPPSTFSRVVMVTATAVSLLTGIVLGSVGTRERIWKKFRKRIL